MSARLQQLASRFPVLTRVFHEVRARTWQSMALKATGFVAGTVFARNAGPQALGEFALASTIVILAAIVAELGLSTSIRRHLAQSSSNARALLLANTKRIWRVSGPLAWVTAVAASAWAYGWTVTAAVACLGVSMLGTSLRTATLAYEAELMSPALTVPRVTSGLCASVAGVVVAAMRPVAWCYGAVLGAFHLFELAWISLRFRGQSERSTFMEVTNERVVRVGHLLRESVPLLLAGLVNNLHMRVDQFMLERLMSATELGRYAAATRITEMLSFAPMHIAAAVLPVLCARQLEDTDRYRRTLLWFSGGMWSVGLVGAAGLLVSAPVLLPALYGGAYVESVPVLRLHAVSFVFVCVGVARSQWIYAEGKTDFMIYAPLFGLMANVGFNLLWIPDHGAKGAAMATAVSYFLAGLPISLLLPAFRPWSRIEASSLLWCIRAMWQRARRRSPEGG